MCLIKLLRENLKLCFNLLPVFEKYMLIVERVGGPIKKKNLLSFLKKKHKAKPADN